MSSGGSSIACIRPSRALDTEKPPCCPRDGDILQSKRVPFTGRRGTITSPARRSSDEASHDRTSSPAADPPSLLRTLCAGHRLDGPGIAAVRGCPPRFALRRARGGEEAALHAAAQGGHLSLHGG